MDAKIIKFKNDYFLQVTKDCVMFAVIKSGDTTEVQLEELANPRYFVKEGVLCVEESSLFARELGSFEVVGTIDLDTDHPLGEPKKNWVYREM